MLRNAEGQAADGLLTASRVKVVLMTVKRNAQWCAANGPVAYGRRMRFDGSRLVWQSYPGQGIQIQWLGTFGRMNQLFLAKGYDTELAAMAREIESYAVAPRRRDRLGVPVRLRRRAAAVGQRPRPGHRHPDAVARRGPAQGHALVRRRAQRARASSARRRRRACA